MVRNVPEDRAQDLLLQLWRYESGRDGHLLSDGEFFPVNVRCIIEELLDFTYEVVDAPGAEQVRFDSLHGVTNFTDRRIQVRVFGGSPGRQLYSAAHEIGHVTLHAAAYGEEYRPHPTRALKSEANRAFRKREWEADVFAEALLMPPTAVKSKFSDIFREDSLRRRAAVQFLEGHGHSVPRNDLVSVSMHLAQFDDAGKGTSLQAFFGASKTAMGRRIRTLNLLTP